ncbi:MAG: hypothetical protein IJ713_08805 [Oscillibacter sp.]|nr:hypothetical protein [Oscillibacter sp.]
MEKKASGKGRWKELFLFTKDGRIKSLDLMYGFFLAVGLLFLDFVISNRLTLLLETLLAEQGRGVKNAADTLVPALLCALAAALLFRLIRKKRIVLIAHWIAWIIAAVLLIAMLFLYDRETLGLLWPPFACIFGVPATVNAAVVTALFARWRKRQPKGP